ncbi:hypothetical protein FHI69_02535 [Janthinobacterium lividum]|uniref:Uncharacterized protein n=1 Tax=Janthinobacterium lividum TaxID=29581 RepID=A0A5C4NWU6_9BURK|nr:hypothetical protein [Janthinobacterium lividum]TNC78195.1 hypothetical protein FHI69_02535 [Janthinobacterium lividum]
MSIWIHRAFRLSLVLGALWFVRYLVLKVIESAKFSVDVQGLLNWMNGNDKLSGWAQFYGALIAIFFAIAVPAWQRHSQNLDRWRDGEDINASLSQNSFFLIGEVFNYVNGCANGGAMPRAMLHDSDRCHDLLKRIHALELREISPDRITRLFHARGHLLNSNSSLSNLNLQDAPLSPGERQLFSDRLDHLKLLVSEAKNENGEAIHARARAHLWLLPRIAHPVIRYVIG